LIIISGELNYEKAVHYLEDLSFAKWSLFKVKVTVCCLRSEALDDSKPYINSGIMQKGGPYQGIPPWLILLGQFSETAKV
jgi:hypothetical protein